MWNSLHRRHCSDEQLLAQLDGELPVFKSEWVKKHLNLCWDCRNRSHELEVQTQGVAKALREDSLAGQERTAEGKLRFLTWRQEFERSFKPEPRLSFGLSRQTAVIAGLCAMAMLIVVGSRSPRTMGASEILARIRGEEENLYATPLLVHQTFRLRMSQIQPESRERIGQLEIWSDSGGRRFASRWQDASGKLRHAVWRSDRGREYFYNSKLAPGVVSSKKESSNQIQWLADLSGSALDLEKLELGLMAWIETRQWRPIAASSDLNTFVSQEGAILRAERDEMRICLQAVRAVGAARIEISLELDRDTYKPRLQKIRFENSGRVMEVELTSGKCEFVNSAHLAPSVFEPETTLIASLPPVVARQPVAPAAEPEPIAYVEVDDLTPLEIEARYALHRAKGCLGEPIEVLQVIGKHGQGYIEIRGFVETQDRKKELSDALAELTSVLVNIRTAEEALRESPRPASPAAEPDGKTAIHLSSRPLPIQGALEEYFAQDRQNTAPITQRIADFSTQAVSLSQGSLSHGWALRRLAERYGDKRKGDLLPRSRWLLEVMVRDHISALEAENRRTRALLEPLLLQIQARSDVQLTSSTPVNESNRDWRTLSLNLFATNKQIDTLIRALFAGADPPQPREFNATTDGEEAKKSVTDLINAFRRLHIDLASSNEEIYGIPLN